MKNVLKLNLTLTEFQSSHFCVDVTLKTEEQKDVVVQWRLVAKLIEWAKKEIIDIE